MMSSNPVFSTLSAGSSIGTCVGNSVMPNSEVHPRGIFALSGSPMSSCTSVGMSLLTSSATMMTNLRSPSFRSRSSLLMYVREGLRMILDFCLGWRSALSESSSLVQRPNGAKYNSFHCCSTSPKEPSDVSVKPTETFFSWIERLMVL
jgi:hypothetical protein